MLALALAILAGVALFPVFLVFPPVYFPWTLLVETAAGAIAGLAIPQVTDRWGARVGLTAAAVVGAAAILGALGDGSRSTSGSPVAARSVAVVATLETPDLLRRLRRTTLLNARPLPRELSG